MGDQYLDFPLPCCTKIAVGHRPLAKWRPIENKLSITWNALNFDHIYLDNPIKKLNDFFTKQMNHPSFQ